MKVIAVDLGASNGRLILAEVTDDQLKIEELHRFSNAPVYKGDHLFWDINNILDEIKIGIIKYVNTYGGQLNGIGIDTWGVDFGFITSNDTLFDNPYSYRDTQTVTVMEEVHQKITSKEFFQRTGVKSSAIHTVYQLYAILKNRAEIKENIEIILTMPGLIGFLLTGKKYNEFTHVSTTQLYNFQAEDWDWEIIDDIFSDRLPLGKIKKTNTIIGNTNDEMNKEIGLEPTPVVNIPGHDTACAVSAISFRKEDSAFLSCGTWNIIGIEVDKPVITEAAFQWGFTNEGTAEHTYRLQKNNVGMWLLQQCKKEWETQGIPVTYDEEYDLTKNAPAFKSLIDPDHEMFFNPNSMIQAIQDFCISSGQRKPESKGEIIRCILESLALKHRWVIEKLEAISNRRIQLICMIGGGVQNKLFCQIVANATKKCVQAGPVEASAIGNALCQFVALGKYENLSIARESLEESFEINEYIPENSTRWEKVYKEFINLL